MTGNRIKEVIKEKGYNITSLAEKMGIYRESLSRMLTSPSYPTLENIANALNVPIWQLFVSPSDVLTSSDSGVSGFIKIDGVIHEVHSIEDIRKLINN
jgi:transcriptional regulator with XRE-family HTH domain